MEKEGEGEEGTKKDALKLLHVVGALSSPATVDEIGWKK